MAEILPNKTLSQEMLINQLASKLDLLMTEDQLEKHLGLVIKMGLNQEILLADLCEYRDISMISNDPNLLKKAIVKSKNVGMNKDQNLVFPKLPVKRNKVFL